MTLEKILASLDEIKDWQEETYKHLHAHPELSMQESETVKFIEETLTSYGYDTQVIGGGVVGVLVNGAGPKVLFRADIDGLPVKEETGLAYASQVEMTDKDGQTVPVMHACGHDTHITAGLGAAWALAQHKDSWSGTYIALFQPGEEIAAGAKSMLADGLVDRIPKPDVALAQHVLTTPEAGKVGSKVGPFLSSAASLKVVVKGQGAHGSMPNLSIDPIVIGSAIVSKLQSIVAREVDPFKFAVVTVGSFQAGLKANIIPDKATLLLNIRAYDEEVKEQLLAAIRRIVLAECQAGGCLEEPEISVFDNYPLTTNDAQVRARVASAFEDYLGQENVVTYDPMTASEDFSYIAQAFDIPYLYWGFGGFVAGQDVYPNHSPKFAPAIQPTLETGTKAALIAAYSYLGK
ncbi:amidohydrolase [Streptococcus loxodontisalivarius]|uniref:Hippurate hydrolase n=1 Tax=Streptococcus loxodontisalivarius TaxID=1349415 RepID=A0ABS2PQF2_9STRE|nr:amidohydrolase [Streptococcus loxodontisalivarius]MBM7642268.1 hippurate hydrolase [Streptococcus loxodontisalivarius]